jgi:hypothetical protein
MRKLMKIVNKLTSKQVDKWRQVNLSTRSLVYLFTFLLVHFFPVSAQMRIGSEIAPNASAVLDLNPDNTTTAGNSTKGLALPRVALTSASSASPLAGHVKGMTVYNTATAGDVLPGVYCSDGSKWVRLDALPAPASKNQILYYDGNAWVKGSMLQLIRTEGFTITETFPVGSSTHAFSVNLAPGLWKAATIINARVINTAVISSSYALTGMTYDANGYIATLGGYVTTCNPLNISVSASLQIWFLVEALP